MSNVHGLFSGKKDDDSDNDDENNRFVGGIGDRGGGRYEKDATNNLMAPHCIFFRVSHFCLNFFLTCLYVIDVCNSGLAVQPNMEDGNDRDRVFGMAENATADDSGQVRRTITMVRNE